MDLSAPKLPPKPLREQAKVLYAYEAQNEDELTIREGDIINVLSKDIEDQGWFKGELNGKVGVFPDNFVELIRVPSSTTTTTPDPESQAMEQKGLPPRPGKPPAAVAAAASSPSSTTSGHTTTTTTSPASSLIKSLGGKCAESSPVNGKDGGSGTKSSIFANLTKKSSASSSKVTAGSSPAPSLAVTGKTPSFHKPDVLPVDPSHQALDVVSNPTENGSGDSQPTSLSAIEVPAGSKLSHMTATRPKGPSNRRPPSYISVNNNSTGGRDSLTDGVTENGHNEGPTSANGKHSIPHSTSSSNNNNMTSSSSTSNTTTATFKPGNKEDPPWIIELRRTQEAKKQGSHHALPSLTERQSSVDSTTGSTDSGPSSLVSHTRPPPLTKSHSVASSGGVTHNNRASGDFSNRIGQFNGSSPVVTGANNSTNSPHANPTTTAASDSQPSSTSSPNPVSILKPMKPIKPVTSSGTGSLTKKDVAASPTVSSSSPATSHVSPVTPSSTTTSASAVTKSSSDKVASPAATLTAVPSSGGAVIAPSIPSAACGSSGGTTTTTSGGASVSTSGANSSTHSSSSSSSSSHPAIIPAATPAVVTGVPDPGTTGLLIADLQRELQLLRETTVPVTQYQDLAKQVQELRDLMEQQKQSQSRIVKELIDDLAEERKKLAMLTIDVDRLRKLSAATV